LLGPLISLVIIRLKDHDIDDSSSIKLLSDLLRKYLYCQRNHGNQKKVLRVWAGSYNNLSLFLKVFKQFCDSLLWDSLQLKCLCTRLGIQSELLSLANKLLASLFNKLVYTVRPAIFWSLHTGDLSNTAPNNSK